MTRRQRLPAIRCLPATRRRRRFGGTPTTCSDTSTAEVSSSDAAECSQRRRERQQARIRARERDGTVQLADARLPSARRWRRAGEERAAPKIRPPRSWRTQRERRLRPSCSAPPTSSAKTTTSAPTAACSEPLPDDGHMRVLDGAGLQDVERLAARDTFLRDRSAGPRATRPRPASLCASAAAERSGADDRNYRHQE